MGAAGPGDADGGDGQGDGGDRPDEAGGLLLFLGDGDGRDCSDAGALGFGGEAGLFDFGVVAFEADVGAARVVRLKPPKPTTRPVTMAMTMMAVRKVFI